MKQKVALFFAVLVGLTALLSATKNGADDIGSAATIHIFSNNAALFSSSVGALQVAIKAIDKHKLSITTARDRLKDCRISYKRIAFFACYFFPSETRMYNGPPKYEVEEPELELEEPMGLQQIEALLFDDHVVSHKSELLAQADALYGSAKDLPTLLYHFTANDRQVLESIRIELIRISTLYISGYDAPLLKSGITETLETSKTIQLVLQPYFNHYKNSLVLSRTLKNSIQYLQAHQQFNSFNRMEYLLKYALPMQQQLGLWIKKQHLELNTSVYLNYDAPHLFSKNFLKGFDSIPGANQQNLIALGRQLFFDPLLSGNLKVSCASCHQPEKYFADGKTKSASLVHDTVLKRNTPTLFYAGKQHTQFWDGRAGSLTGQIKDVLFNPLEMSGKRASLQNLVLQNPAYDKTFRALFPEGKDEDKSVDHMAIAIAAFVSSLSPMNSPFDQYISGNMKAMTAGQVKGFNLFMGKAQCGTCHFAPYFNSLVPPLYDVSELEILGTPKTDRLDRPQYDDDMGRYDLYRIRYYKQAFKTPTVRNAEKTGPYMHNGAFKTLESVLDFYNKGGGIGLGLNTEEQTLPSKPLNLSKQEITRIIQFIHSLTDKN